MISEKESAYKNGVMVALAAHKKATGHDLMEYFSDLIREHEVFENALKDERPSYYKLISTIEQQAKQLKKQDKETAAICDNCKKATTGKIYEPYFCADCKIEQQAKELEKWEKEARLQFKLFNEQIDETRKWREENEHLRTKLQQIDGQRMDAERACEKYKEQAEYFRENRGEFYWEVKQENSELRNQLKIAVEALEWYGHEETYEMKSDDESNPPGQAYIDVIEDAGEIARNALSQIGKENSHETER